MAILAGDIGGTKTVLAVFDAGGGGLEAVSEATYPSAAHGSLEEILADFLEDQSDVALGAACFGVAGAVIEGKARITNLPWVLEAEALAEASGAQRVVLLNDLEAAAYGTLTLGPDERVVLNAGSPPSRQAGSSGANIGVIAAGTGLGEALLYWDGARHHAVASEGGHAGFAPRNDEQIELLRFLRSDFGGHVSVERVLSGAGLNHIYRFVLERSEQTEPAWIAERMANEDPAAVIAELALEDEEPRCRQSLELFASIYGAEAGDMALRYMALGGVVLCGGIAPKILPVLEGDAFLHAFSDKGRFSDLVAGLEVSVALDPRTALRGAAEYAARL